MRLAILGAGPGGYVAAIRAAQLGAQVTIIEEEEVGGTCLNKGCIPTKTIIASTNLLDKTRRLGEFGIESRGEIRPNLSAMLSRKDKVVRTQIKGIRNLFKSRGIQLKDGRGALTSSRTILVSFRDGSQETIEADMIIIATGSRPYSVAAFPFDGKRILSSTDLLKLTEIPKSLLIVGGGVIGCEFACIFAQLGTEVTVVEMLDRVLPTEDAEISDVLEREFKKKKIKVYINTKVEKIVSEEGGAHAFLHGEKEITADKVLVATGRAFNSAGIGLEAAGVAKGVCGEILVNNRMETNVPGVYAVGDVTGGLLLAHVASREGITAVINALGANSTMDYTAVPSAIFTSPETASVGLREFQAVEKGIKIKTGHFPFRSLGKAHALGEIEGLVKVISDAETDKVLGVHIIGPHASLLIHEAALAVRKGLKTRDIAETIHAHPTLSEALMEAAADVLGEALHVIRKETSE
ncbi:MAG: dihydrolipoyl dehydrogenase [Nitrospirota bacterium]